MVVYCKTHGLHYTVYPPGHVPYGRAPVAASGAGAGLSGWRGTVFEPAVCPGWRRQYEYGGGTCWHTRRRWLRRGGKLLGLSGEVTVGEGVAALLEIPLHLHAAARVCFSSGKIDDECTALANVLTAVAVTPRLWRQMMRAGRLTRMGDLYVQAVTRADVERWVAWAERRTKRDGQLYAKDSVHSWWRVLVALLRDAAAELQLPFDPTYRVRPPRTRVNKRREHRTLSAAELGKLLGKATKLSPERYAEIYVLAYTGMRAGELFALEWDDINEDRGLIHIRRSVWRGQVSAPKTDDPRDVALTSEMEAVLRLHRRQLIAGPSALTETDPAFLTRTSPA